MCLDVVIDHRCGLRKSGAAIVAILDKVTGTACALAVIPVLLLSAPAHAQLTEADLQPTGEANAAYDGEVASSGLQSEIVYLKPSAPFEPDASITIDVPEPEEDAGTRRDTTVARWVWGAIFAAILIGVIALFITQGGAIGVSFGGPARDDRRGPDPDRMTQDAFDAINRQPLDQFLASLRAMADRRMALILLVSRALERAADQNDVRLGRAQTARDILRVLPASWRHLPALRGLVREAEIVHFGGRDLTEDKWEECFAAAEPIFRRGAAA